MGNAKKKETKTPTEEMAKAPKTRRIVKLLAAYSAKDAWKTDMAGLLNRAKKAEALVKDLTEKLEKESAKVSNLEGQLEAKGA